MRTGAAGITDALHAKSQIFLGQADVAHYSSQVAKPAGGGSGSYPQSGSPKAGKPLGVGAVDH